MLRTAYEFTHEVIVVEPFLIPKDFGMDGLRNSLFERIYAIRRLANEFGAVYLPMDGIFAENWVERTPEFYTVDCIHLTAEGKKLLAEEWLKKYVPNEFESHGSYGFYFRYHPRTFAGISFSALLVAE